MKVQVRVRLQCQPLSEEQFKPIIADNYYSLSNFWFELDHAQTSKLISVLSSRVVTPSASVPQNSAAWRTLFRLAPPRNMKEESKNCKPHLKIDSAHSDQSNRKLGSSDVASCLDRRNLLLEAPSDKLVVENDEKDLILSQLRDLVRSREYKDSISSSCAGDSYPVNDSQFDDKGLVKEQIVLEERNRDSPVSSSDFDPVIARVVEKITCPLIFGFLEHFCYISICSEIISLVLQLIREELKGFKEEHIQRMSYMEQRLVLVILNILEFFILSTPFLMLFVDCFNKFKLKNTPIFPWIIFCMVFYLCILTCICFLYLGVISGSLRVP